MKVDAESGLLLDARLSLSPNHDERPETDIDLVVVHNISLPPGKFGEPWIEDFFLNKLDTSAHEYFEEISDLKVSCHLLIRRDGELVQFVPFHMRAWHAGESCYSGRERCNDFSIGIELEGADDIPYEEIQYEQLSAVIMALEHAYPGVRHERVAGHSKISPGRKTDPGPAFNWAHLRGLLDSLEEDSDNHPTH